MAIRHQRNADLRTDAPPADWFPNLMGREDIPDDIVKAFTILREDVQRLYPQIQAAKADAREAINAQAAPQSVLTTFTEITIGSPTDPAGAVRIRAGRDTPEGVIEGSAWRDVWLRTNAAGITSFLYIKTTEGKTGWVAAAL